MSNSANGGVEKLALGVVVLGVLIRVWGYLTGGSLWLDELFIVSNLSELTARELLGPLRYGQNAPVGWLLLHKWLLNLGGDSALALRLPSLLVSLAALPMMLVVARATLGARCTLIAVLIVATSPFVVWQSFQLKPYSFDLFVALGLTCLALQCLGGSVNRINLLGGCGAMAIGFSMPSVFVLCGLGTGLLFHYKMVAQATLRAVVVMSFWSLVWLALFLVNYTLFLRPYDQPHWLRDYWSAKMFVWPPETLAEFLWIPRVLVSAMSEPVGFVSVGAIALIPIAAGIIRCLSEKTGTLRSRRFLVVSPVLICFGAAGLGAYPFGSRLIVFLVPGLGVLFALGFIALGDWMPRHKRAITIGAAVMLSVPFGLTSLWLPDGGLPVAADTRSLFRELDAVRGDTPVLIEHTAQHAWRHYGKDIAAQEMPRAWRAAERVDVMRRSIVTADAARLWIVLSPVSEHTPAPGAWAAVMQTPKTAAMAPQRLYVWFVQRRRNWPTLDSFRRALPPGWFVEREIRVEGGCLWLLARSQ